ncbi:helix-turn-helix domain-containing protein [Paraburkholderia sediminicola]
MNQSDNRARYETRLGRVLDHIYDHLDEPLDIDRLAQIACMSPYHWHRIFQAMYGETVATTVRRLRLHRAAGYLANGSMPIAEIAERSGYSSLQSFSRTFRAVFGMPKMNSLNSLASILPRRMSAALKRKLSSWDRVIFSCCILLFTFVSYRRRFYRITRQRPSKIRYVSVNGFFDHRMDAKKPREPFWLRGFGNTAELPRTSDDGAEEDRTVAPLRSYCSKIPS